MLIYDSQLPSTQRTRLEGAVNLIKRAIAGSTNFPKNLHRDLKEMLVGQGSEATVATPPYAVIAYDSRTDGPWGYTGGACVWLTERVFQAKEDRLAAVLVHELVHVLCGRELDSEVSEFHHFPNASTLNQGDLTIFRQANWRGRWFRLIKKNRKAVAMHDWGEIELPIPPDQVDQYDIPTQ